MSPFATRPRWPPRCRSRRRLSLPVPTGHDPQPAPSSVPAGPLLSPAAAQWPVTPATVVRGLRAP